MALHAITPGCRVCDGRQSGEYPITVLDVQTHLLWSSEFNLKQDSSLKTVILQIVVLIKKTRNFRRYVYWLAACDDRDPCTGLGWIHRHYSFRQKAVVDQAGLWDCGGYICVGVQVLLLSECLNQMHQDEKSFEKEKKEKLAASRVEKMTKKNPENNANSSSATAKSPSEYT
ncbi:hypothetical protein TNCV_3554921 [Trichonephila clavipes]|nr:hypothetical protein TNCV_3554921 [Trichonephila clavipes]